MPTLSELQFCMFTVLSGGLGAYLGPYLRKRAENLATHDDIDKLLVQIKATTEVTESIKAEISGDIWARQRQWEMKREVLFEAAKRVAEVRDALATLGSVFMLMETHGGSEWEKKADETSVRWVNASSAMDETLLLVGVVCDETTINVCNAFQKVATHTAKKAATKDIAGFKEDSSLFHVSFSATRNAIRRELGIPELLASQSNESSATPNPD
jgi:hypothetical protein